MTSRTVYRVAGESLLVESCDSRAADAVETVLANCHFVPCGEPADPAMPPAIVVTSTEAPPPVPREWPAFDVAGGGTCYASGAASYIEIDGAVVATGRPARSSVEVWMDGGWSLDDPRLIRLVTYGLAIAMRRCGLFQLHCGALLDPDTGRGVLIVGPSGSGKSTLTVHLAAAGWPYLTDDVVALGRRDDRAAAWPLRRCFAITAETFSASRVLREQTSFADMPLQADDKRQFLPGDVFPAAYEGACVPSTVFFSELSHSEQSRIARLSPPETMGRLIRMSPWSCYDRPTAAQHLSLLSLVAKQATAFCLSAGRDLLDPDAAPRLMAGYLREHEA